MTRMVDIIEGSVAACRALNYICRMHEGGKGAYKRLIEIVFKNLLPIHQTLNYSRLHYVEFVALDISSTRTSCRFFLSLFAQSFNNFKIVGYFIRQLFAKHELFSSSRRSVLHTWRQQRASLLHRILADLVITFHSIQSRWRQRNDVDVSARIR